MKDKKIAIYLVVSVIVLAMIIGVTVWLVTGKKRVKNKYRTLHWVLLPKKNPRRVIKRVFRGQ